MKATCTNCGCAIYRTTSTDPWHHESERWANDNGVNCFENVYQFNADPRSIEEINFRKKFDSVEFMPLSGIWIAIDKRTGEKVEDPFLNKFTPITEKYMELWWQFQEVRLKNEKYKDKLRNYERR